MSYENHYFAHGPSTVGFLASGLGDPMPFPFGGVMYGHTLGLLGFSGDGVLNEDNGLNQQNSYTLFAGVEGVSVDHTGVAGISFGAPGVFGQTEDPTGIPGGFVGGVVGAAQTQPGVIGYSKSGDAVQGASFTGNAVRGYSFFGHGVHGLSGGNGPTVPNYPAAGVFGTSTFLPGVIGTSDTDIGVFGYSNTFGVVGQSTDPASFAGFFLGNLRVTGTITAAVKNGVVKFPDGSQRLLHCMESPEHWFEDFGEAKLKDGRAVVKLDADFAKTIKRGDYHVFLTPKGDCGLYVRHQGGDSFEVRELAGGKSNVAFSYRIAGRRGDIKRHRRFSRLDTRSPLRAKTPPRKATAAALRRFVAGLEKEARARLPKAAKRRRRPAKRPVRFGRSSARAAEKTAKLAARR